jgi:hypothetical protein
VIRTGATIVIVDEVFSSGDLTRGVQTVAFNMPNDEAFVARHGSKRVMMRNVQKAKFDHILVPLAEKLMAPGTEVSFEAFFQHVVLHESSHGLGPHLITVNGVNTTVRDMLRDVYAPIEEAKADVVALFALKVLKDTGAMPEIDLDAVYTTYVASSFRSMRFGLREAHGRGQALQFNFLVEQGAVAFAGGRCSVDLAAFPAAVENLARFLLALEGNGDYAGATAALDKYASALAPEIADALAAISATIPTDIQPVFDIDALTTR